MAGQPPIRPGPARRALLALLLWSAAVPAAANAADPTIPVRAAVHDRFTRLVFDFPRPAAATLRRQGAALVVGFSTPGVLRPAHGVDPARMRNIRAASFSGGTAVLTLAQGVTVRSYGLGNRQVVDLFDPALPGQPPPTAPPSKTPPLKAPPAKPQSHGPRPIAPMQVAQPRLATAASLDVPAATLTLDAVPPPVARGDEALPSRPDRGALEVPPDDATAPVALALPAGTAAAVLRRGDTAQIVFDAPRAIDPASLRARPGFETATVQLLPHAVVISLKAPANAPLSLTRSGVTWSIALGPAAQTTDTAAIAPRAEDGRLHLPAPAGGHVVVIPDPVTGENLLVGTVPDAGPFVATGRRFAPFTLLPTVLGVAVEPLSDQVTLRAVPDGFVPNGFVPNGFVPSGFVVESGAVGGALAVAADDAAQAVAPGPGRSFDLPNRPIPALLRQLAVQTGDAAAAPVGGRLPFRRAVAQTMVALGLGPEAQGVLRIAASDDPRALADPAIQALSGAAALVAGRYDQADGLATATPDETVEHRLWRGLVEAARLPEGVVPEEDTVRRVAAGADLLQSYPPTLRRSLLPLAADTLLRGGALASADRLLAALPGDPGLALARAAALQAHGQNDAALQAYDRLTQQPDRSVRMRAALAALRLRVQLNRLAPAAAADAADRLLYAWRGDARERDLRLQIADWRGAAGQYRQQLETLREALMVFPQPADGVQQKLSAVFADIVAKPVGAGIDRLDPLDLVSLVQGNLDLLPPGPAGGALLDRLADRLAALDLPQQAEAVLTKLIGGTTAPAIRAALGARLATLQLGEGDPRAALAALLPSPPSPPSPQDPAVPLPPDLAQQRTLLAAQANAQLGNAPAALAALGGQDAAPVVLERARVLGQAHDWRGAAAALSDYASRNLPAAGKLNGAQAGVVLQLASDLAQTNDDAGLARLRAQFTGRLTDPNDSTLLSVLTESPVQSVNDLPRAAAETRAAQAIPVALQETRHAE
jgi:hypothetical protein